jgi:hypothetical protein
MGTLREVPGSCDVRPASPPLVAGNPGPPSLSRWPGSVAHSVAAARADPRHVHAQPLNSHVNFLDLCRPGNPPDGRPGARASRRRLPTGSIPRRHNPASPPSPGSSGPSLLRDPAARGGTRGGAGTAGPARASSTPAASAAAPAGVHAAPPPTSPQRSTPGPGGRPRRPSPHPHRREPARADEANGESRGNRKPTDAASTAPGKAAKSRAPEVG